MKTYREYLVNATIVAAILLAMLVGAFLPLLLVAWFIASGVWPLAIPAALLYIPVGAAFVMFLDRMDGE